MYAYCDGQSMIGIHKPFSLLISYQKPLYQRMRRAFPAESSAGNSFVRLPYWRIVTAFYVQSTVFGSDEGIR
jgi:hypothetical protein